MKITLALLVLLLLLPGLAARAEENEDRVQYLRTIVIEANESVEDAVCVFCSIIVRGTVQGDVVVVGGGATVESVVAGDVVILGGGLQLAPGARVAGDVVVYGGPVEEGAPGRVAGEIDSNRYFHLPGQRQVFLPGAAVVLALNWVLALLGFLLLRPRGVEAQAATLRRRYLTGPLLGAAVAAVLFAGAVVAFSLDKDLVGWILWSALGLLVIAGYPGMALSLGRLLARDQGTIAALFAGGLLATGLLLIPVAGVLMFAILVSLAAGTALLWISVGTAKPRE